MSEHVHTVRKPVDTKQSAPISKKFHINYISSVVPFVHANGSVVLNVRSGNGDGIRRQTFCYMDVDVADKLVSELSKLLDDNFEFDEAANVAAK